MAEQESRLVIRIDSQNAKKTTDQLARALLNLEENGDQASQSASRLDAENKKLSNTLKNTTGNVSSANTALDSLVLSMRNVVFATTAASVGVTGFINNVASSAKIIQQYAELSKQSAEMFQYNAVGAKSAGFEMKDYGDILKDVYDRLGEVNRGEGEMMDFFERIAPKIGMTVEQFRNLSAHDALQAYYNGLERANLSHPEMITYMEQIANDSALLIPLLKENGKGFKELGDKAKEAGAIMSNEMVRDLNAARSEFNEIKMQAQGLGNELTVTLLPALRFIAANFEAITDAGIVLGMAAITKAMLDQFLAMQKSVAASVQRRAAAAAELQAQAQLAAVELQRSRQNVAIAAQEIHLARLDLNSATTKQARALAVQRLTAAEIAHNIALNANSKATAVNTAATTANNAAKTLGARAAALASAAFLGPAGIVIGVTALTAGYLLMSNNGDDANDMLKDQAGYAGMAADELERLSGNQAKAAKVDLTTAIKAQSQELKNVKRDFEDLVLALYKESDNKDLYRIWAEMTTGVLGTEEAFKRLNAVESIEASDIKRAADYEKEHRDLNKTLLDSKEKLKLVENGIDGAGKKAKESAAEIKGLSEEIKKLLKEADQSIITSAVNTALASNGYDDDLIAIINKYIQLDGAITKNAKGQSVFRDEIKKKINEEYAARMKEISALDTRNEKERERTKELEKQAKLTKASTIDAVIASGEGGYNSYNNGVAGDAKGKTKNLTGMTLAQVMAKQKGSKSTGRELFAVGKYQIIPSTLRDAVSALKLDKNQLFNPEMQEKIFREYLVSVKQPNVKKFITGKGGLSPALDALAVEFASVADPTTGQSKYGDRGGNKASISSEKMAQSLLATQKIYRENIALGMSAEEAWAKSFNAQSTVVKQAELDIDKYLQEVLESHESQAEERKRISNEVADYETQVRNRLKDELEKVDAAGFSDVEAKKAKDFYEKQANLDIQAFKDAQQAKLDALKDFQLTEAQLINKRASDQEKDLKRQQELGELTLEQYTEGSLLIEKRRKQEIAAANAARDARINAANEANMSVSDAAHKRYAEEMKQLDQIIDKEEALAVERGINRQYISLGVGPEGTYFDGFSTNSDQIQLGQEDQLNSLYIKQFEEMQLRYTQQRELAIQQNKELTQIEADYLEEKARLNDQYNERIGVARQADHEAQLSMYGSMLSQASSVWGDMTQIVRDSAGEQSGAYKAMFLAQQMFAIGSAMISTHLAATQAMAAPDMVLFGQKIAAPAAITALGYANVGMIAAQTIAGFKNGGLITGPGTGTSDSIPIMASNEEFMMRHAAVKSIGVDNLNYMNKYGKLPEQTNRVGNNIANTMNGNAVNVQVEPKIIVNVPEGFTAQQSQSSDGTITLDVIKSVVRGTLREDIHNVNSDFGKSLRQAYNVGVKRF